MTGNACPTKKGTKPKKTAAAEEAAAEESAAEESAAEEAAAAVDRPSGLNGEEAPITADVEVVKDALPEAGVKAIIGGLIFLT